MLELIVSQNEVRVSLPEALDSVTIARLYADLCAAMQGHAGAVVLQGTEGLFCRGLDFEYVLRAGYKDFDPVIRMFVELLLLLRHGPKPTIAVVDGEARGAGAGIAAATDLVIATPASEFGLPEALFGIGSEVFAPFLRERVAPQKARLLGLISHAWTAEEAYRLGLVDRVVDITALAREVKTAARRMSLANPAGVAILKGHMAGRGPEALRAEVEIGAKETLTTIRDPQVRDRIRRFMVEGVAPWR